MSSPNAKLCVSAVEWTVGKKSTAKLTPEMRLKGGEAEQILAAQETAPERSGLRHARKDGLWETRCQIQKSTNTCFCITLF